MYKNLYQSSLQLFTHGKMRGRTRRSRRVLDAPSQKCLVSTRGPPSAKKTVAVWSRKRCHWSRKWCHCSHEQKVWLQKLDSSNSAGCIHYWKKLRRSIQNATSWLHSATSWLHSATSWLHFELEEATFLLRLLKKALMALPVLYLSTWI